MSNDVDGVLVYIALLGGIVWAIWHYDLNPISDEITVYLQEYKCKKENNKKCYWGNSLYVTYKVNPDMQTVISWSSVKPWPLRKVTNCVIKNKKNWSCKDEGDEYGFNEGEFSGIDDGEQHRFISKTRWWVNKVARI